MFERIEDDLTSELKDKYSVKQSSKYLVYFDSITSNILSITNEVRDDLLTFFEIDFEKVKMFLTGQADPWNYKVVLNPSKTFEIVSKVITHAAKSSELIPIKLTDNLNLSLLIFHSAKDKSWKFILSQDEQHRLMNDIINYRIDIFITSRNNKNMLYRIVSVNLADLVKENNITIPFNSDVEHNLSGISLSTVKFLESYGLVNDSKV